MAVPTIASVTEALRPVFEHHNVKRAVLFGSVAKGTADEHSDVDLLVDSGLDGFAFVTLYCDAADTLRRDVDMFDVTQIVSGSRFETEIRKTGVVIYEND